MRALMIVIGFILNFAQARANSICSDAQFRHLISVPQNLKSFALTEGNELGLKKLNLFGEIHYHTSTTVLTQIIEKVSPQLIGRKCLFVEFSSAVTADEFISKVTSALRQLPSGPSEERTDYSQFLNYFGPIFTSAKTSGLKIYTVDHPKNFGQGMDLNIRDIAMASQIKNHLDRDCDSALMFVGKAHITADTINRQTLKAQLSSMRIPLATFNVEHASDPVSPFLASWNGLCDQNLPVPPAPVIFSNQIVSADAELWPRLKNGKMLSGFWRDFDFTILAP